MICRAEVLIASQRNRTTGGEVDTKAQRGSEKKARTENSKDSKDSHHESRTGAKYKPRARKAIDLPNSKLTCYDFTVGEQVTAHYDGGLSNLRYRGIVKSISVNKIDVELHELTKTVTLAPSLLVKGYELCAQ